MYRIYIRNYIGAASPTEDVLFDSSDVQNSESDRTVLDPIVKNELNKAGSLEFTVTPANPFYDKIKIVKTIFTVYLDDTMIFRGRVMTISDDIFKQRGIFCEGELAYFNDSLQPPVKEQQMTIGAYLSSVISDHNKQMRMFGDLINKTDDIDKCFELGTVNVGDGKISYRINSKTGEVISEGESSNFSTPGHNGNRSNDIYVNTDNTAAFTWELNGINTASGVNEDNLLRIRTANAVYVRSGSVVVAKPGYKIYVCMYSRYSGAEDFEFITPAIEVTDTYMVPDDCYIRIVIARVPTENETVDEEESEPEEIYFTEGDPETVPANAVILSGLVIITSILHTSSMVATPFNNSGYRNSFDVIQNDLIDIYGGYISIRYENGHRYVDYTSDPPNSTGSSRIISFGVNLQEVSKEISAEDLYSVLLPTGDSDLLLTQASKNKMISSEASMYMLPQNAVSTYGPIFKTQSFSGISKREELRDYAGNFISKTWRGASESYTFKTVDMHFVDDSYPLILIGSRCAITLWPDTAPKIRICTGVTYELQSPENNEHVFEDLPYEREGLTKKYKKQSSGRGSGGGAVSVAPASTDVGSGGEDTIIRSNGNIILYPGQDKMVSIPLAQTFLAPSLTKWTLGNVTYESGTGLNVKHDEKIEKDLFVEGKVSVGTDLYKSTYGSGTVYAQHQVRTDGNMKSPIYWIRKSHSTSSGVYRITFNEKADVPHAFSPHQLTLTGGTDQNGTPVPLVSMWVLGNEDVNFNIAESKWFKDQMGSANVDVVLESIQFDSPTSGKSVLKEHGKAVTLSGSVYLGKAVEIELGPGITETVIERLTDQNGSEKPPLTFSSQDVTSVYNEGYEDALSGVVVYPQNWEYTIEDDESEYYRMFVQAKGKSKYEGAEHDIVCDTYEVVLPDVEAVLSEPANDGSWWKTTGTYAHQYVIPAHSAKAYLKSDVHHEHALSTDSGSAIVIDPAEAIRLGKSQVRLKEPEWIDDRDPMEDHPNTYLISTDGRVNSTTGAPNEAQKYLYPEKAIKSVKVDTVALNGEPTYTPGNHSTADPGYYDVPVKATATNENYKDETLQVIPTSAWLDGFTTGQGSGTTAGYTTGYANGQANVSASITAAGFTSGSFAYDGTDLAVAVSASGTLTKIPETGDPVVSFLSYSGIVGIPVSVNPVVLSSGKWNSETNKIKISKASGGTVMIDDELIPVSVTEKEITVTPGAITIGEPSYEDGFYTITSDGTVDINGDICNLTPGSKTFPADSAIRAGREAAQQDLWLYPGSVTASWNENTKVFDLSCTSNVYSSADASADTLRTETGTGSLSVTPGTAVPRVEWDEVNFVYKVTASGSFTVGSQSFDLEEGSIKGGLYPEDAIISGYREGWRTAAGTSSYPTEENLSSASMTVYVPSLIVDHTPVPLKYTISVDNQYVYLKNSSDVVVARTANTGTTVIKGTISSVTQAKKAEYDSDKKEYSVFPRVNGINLTHENNQYNAAPLKVSSSEAVEQGWGEAYSKLTPPEAYTGDTEKLDFTVGVPLEEYGKNGSYTFSLSKDQPKNKDGFVYVTYDNHIVAKIDVSNWYIAGRDSVGAPIVPKVSKGLWSTGSIRFDAGTSGSDSANVSLGFSIPANNNNGSASIEVVDTASPYSSREPGKIGLSTTLVLTCDNSHATLKHDGTTVAQVPNNKPATIINGGPITLISLRKAGDKYWVYDDVENEYTVYLRAKGTNLEDYDGQVSISGTDARNSVKITGISRVANCVFDKSQRTARQNVLVQLDNGESGIFEGIFDDVYRAGLDGESKISDAEFEVELSSGGIVFDVRDENYVNVSDIWQTGVNHAAESSIDKRYIYASNGGTVRIRNKASAASETVVGEMYPRTPVKYIGKVSPNSSYSYIEYPVTNGTRYVVQTQFVSTSDQSPTKYYKSDGVTPLIGWVGSSQEEEDPQPGTKTVVGATLVGIYHSKAQGQDFPINIKFTYASNTGNGSSVKEVTSQNSSIYASLTKNGDPGQVLSKHSSYYGYHNYSTKSTKVTHRADFTVSFSDGTTKKHYIVEFDTEASMIYSSIR